MYIFIYINNIYIYICKQYIYIYKQYIYIYIYIKQMKLIAITAQESQQISNISHSGSMQGSFESRSYKIDHLRLRLC